MVRRGWNSVVGLVVTASCVAAGLSLSAPATSSPVQGEQAAASVWVPSGSFAGSSMVRVDRDSGPGAPLGGDDVLWAQALPGGRASAQLAVHAQAELSDLTVQVGRLQAPGATPLSEDAVQVRYPRYIPFDGGGVVADPLRETGAVDVAAGDNQPAWITVDLPADTTPGTYTTEVRVSSDDGEIGRWTMRVDVPDVRFDPVDERPFMLDLWPHPDAVADRTGVELWSEQHWAALRPYLRDLADHGQRVVNAAITQDPWMVTHQGEWRPQTYNHYNSTVEWRWDGERFSFDFSVFDRYVRESRAAGIGDRIHAFAMLQFDHRERFVYTDTRTGEEVVEEVDLGDARYREGWGQFLRAFAAHLIERGWFDDASLGFDERPANEMATVFDVVESEAPQWMGKIAIAANSLDVQDYADYVSYNYSFLDSVPDQDIAERRAAGKPTLFYTYFNPVRPNTVTASPPMSARVLGWVVAQRNLDGYLRWTYNSWPADVYSDPSFRYGQGDEYIVYPGEDGPVSSIRWESFTDGQDDAELLRMYTERFGRDDELFRSVVGAVDPRAQNTPEAWTSMLLGRDRIVRRLEGGNGLDVRASVSDRSVAAGDTVELTVSATVTGARPVPSPRLDLPEQAGWDAKVVDRPHREALPPGAKAEWTVEVTVHDDAGSFLYLPGTVTAGEGADVEGRFTTALTVRPPVELTAPPAASPASSPDASAPVTVTVPVANVSDREQVVDVEVSGLGFWRADTPSRQVTVPAGESAEATVELFPDGDTGWTTVDVTVGHGGTTVGSGRVDVVSGGRHVSDWEWTDETNGWGPAERDTSNGEDQPGDGARMSINGREYGKGVGAHAPSRIGLDLAGRCSRFQTDIGVDDEIAGGSVRFRVLADGAEIFASPVLTQSDDARWVDLDVTGVDRLELVVDDGGDGIAQDHGDWAGAWLRCSGR
ncbi:alpha-galactosidase-like protein [Haloactinopolyspora alba]|uniref:Alpha-galactosidase-like protein n=1 Tax=Haloactinopolyspora alba TaxID=648780 RepID=A0A2P8EBT2_9ACTN|nr:glycoside hydrolase domain-containing protein [Haloactinopolyspora alba]PSL06928.1 alpha-galactosidase-like protein [Haloactinopolyspora alba]